MENLRYLLAAIAALTLIMSVVSSVNPSYFAGINVFADDEEDDDNSDSTSNNDHEGALVESLGDNSTATLEIDGDHVALEVEIEDGDLADGTYDVVFACNSSDVSEEFADALGVEEGHGNFATEVALADGTYTDCGVKVGGLSATFASFSIMSDQEADEEEDDNDRPEREREHDRSEKSRLKTDDEGVEIEVEVRGLDMADGSYDAVFACDEPAFNMTLDDAFKVEDGKGKFEGTIGLEDGTYSGCDITVGDTVIASFDTFTVSEETEEEQEHEVEEKRKEKRERLVTTTSGREIHDRHRGERAASPGEYQPGWNYTLTANGTAMPRNQSETADNPVAEVNINMTVWKSTGAVILLDVLDGGTVEIGNQNYTVVLGYALYTIHHDTLRVGALAVDDDGNVYKLKLRGTAEDDAEFPMESGLLDLTFEGSRGPPDRLGDWELTLEGTVEAG